MIGVARLAERKAVIALAWAALTLPAALVALPTGGVLAAVLGSGEGGDATLFTPGGETLVEATRLSVAPLIGTLVSAPWLLLAAALFGLVPWATVMVALSSPAPLSTGVAIGRAIARVPALTLVFGAGLAVRALLLAGGSGLVGWMSTFSPNARTSALWSLVAVALTSVVLAGVRLASDLSEAAVVRHESTAARGTLAGLGALHRRFAPLALRFAAYAAARVAIVAAAAVLAGRVGVATPSHLALVFGVHQVTLLGLCALRAAWLRVALDAVGAEDPARAIEAGFAA